MKERREIVEIMLWIVIFLSFGAILAGILLGFLCDITVFNFDIFVVWLIPSLGALAMALTGLLIYKQFKAQKEINHYTMVPTFKSIVTKDKHEVYLRKRHIQLHFSHQFNNESSNYGFIRVGVFAFVSDSKPDSDNPTYYCYRLRPHRCHQALTFEEEIPIYSGNSVSSSYQLPFAFMRMDGTHINSVDSYDNDIIKEASCYISGKNIKVKNSDINMNEKYDKNVNNCSGIYFNDADDIFRIYFVFMCAVRSENNPEDIYDYIIRDVRNVSFKERKGNDGNPLPLKECFKLQKPYKLPKFLDKLLPRLNDDGTLTSIGDKYKVSLNDH